MDMTIDIMISIKKALTEISRNVSRLSAESVALSAAVDRTLARDIHAREDLPNFDNSAMDGFVVKTADVKTASATTPVRLKTGTTIRAGLAARLTLRRGHAIKIMTGAALPQGGEAVVMVERTRQESGYVLIERAAATGENIRPKGEDVRRGDLLIKKHTILRPYEIALLAAQGIVSVPVISKARVGVLATGDELVDAKVAHLRHGQIRNSNAPAVSAALARWGATVENLGQAADAPVSLRRLLKKSLPRLDMLIISGGVSVGDFDFTKSALEATGFKTIFWRVAIKPGKPLLFGMMGKTAVFGVPGNPVSTLVCLEEFVRPALETMSASGLRHPGWHLSGALDRDQFLRDAKRQHFLFSRVTETDEGFVVSIIRPQGSAMMGMACRANAIATAPAGTQRLKKGDRIAFRWMK